MFNTKNMLQCCLMESKSLFVLYQDSDKKFPQTWFGCLVKVSVKLCTNLVNTRFVWLYIYNYSFPRNSLYSHVILFTTTLLPTKWLNVWQWERKWYLMWLYNGMGNHQKHWYCYYYCLRFAKSPYFTELHLSTYVKDSGNSRFRSDRQNTWSTST